MINPKSNKMESPFIKPTKSPKSQNQSGKIKINMTYC